jgi:hypothetical protein
MFGRQMQVFSFKEVEMDCSSLLGVVLKPIVDSELNILGGSSDDFARNLIAHLPTIFGFWMLAIPAVEFMFSRTTDLFQGVTFKKMVDQPGMVNVLREKLVYGVLEVDVDAACSFHRKKEWGFIYFYPNELFFLQRSRQVIEKLIEENALTKLDLTQVRIAQPPRSEPVIATIGVVRSECIGSRGA